MSTSRPSRRRRLAASTTPKSRASAMLPSGWVRTPVPTLSTIRPARAIASRVISGATVSRRASGSCCAWVTPEASKLEQMVHQNPRSGRRTARKADETTRGAEPLHTGTRSPTLPGTDDAYPPQIACACRST